MADRRSALGPPGVDGHMARVDRVADREESFQVAIVADDLQGDGHLGSLHTAAGENVTSMRADTPRAGTESGLASPADGTADSMGDGFERDPVAVVPRVADIEHGDR